MRISCAMTYVKRLNASPWGCKRPLWGTRKSLSSLATKKRIISLILRVVDSNDCAWLPLTRPSSLNSLLDGAEETWEDNAALAIVLKGTGLIRGVLLFAFFENDRAADGSLLPAVVSVSRRPLWKTPKNNFEILGVGCQRAFKLCCFANDSIM